MNRRTMSPLLQPGTVVPLRLADLVVEAALVAAHDAGASWAHHDVNADLDALLRELLDRGAPAWVCDRVDELAQQHLDAGEDLAEGADGRLDVLQWLIDRPALPLETAARPAAAPAPNLGQPLLRVVPPPTED